MNFTTMAHPLFFLFALSIFLTTSGTAASLSSPYCPTYDCGNGLQLRYPFWLRDKTTPTQFCGYPDFALTCSDSGVPILNLPSDSYYVKNIDYENYTLTLVDIDIVDQPCPRARHNLTINDTVPLSFSSSDLNLTFYFNCTSTASYLQDIPCLLFNGMRSYVSVVGEETEGFDWVENCEEKVVATVMESEIRIGNLSGGFGGAMKKGFVLDWRSIRDCVECEAHDDGLCGYNNTAGESLCFCKDGFISRENYCKGSKTISKKIIIVIVAVGAGTLFASILIIFSFKRKLLKHRLIFIWGERSDADKNIEEFVRNYGSQAPRRFSYSEVKKMTNSFKDKLGQGGYGGVYKGKLGDGRLVAVKVLNKSKGNGEEFINEVASISRTSHVNIVSLLGFCFESGKKALIYEFMSNGSLEKFLCNENPLKASKHLGWEKLYQIAVEIARGLEYLHCGCRTRILHFDVKPHNILLDQDFSPKISDFGLAKLCQTKESIVSMSAARGTIGYVAPEVFSRNFGQVSHKSDVYSYGMMVLEMVGGRNNINGMVDHTSETYFPHWIYRHLEWQQDLGIEGIENKEENEVTRKMILVGLWCIQVDPLHRPSMSKVIEMLEGSIKALQIPPKPFLSSPPRFPIDSLSIKSTQSQ